MSKIHEYIKLLKKQRAAKREMLEAQKKITNYRLEYSLDKTENFEVDACINKFDKVSIKTAATACDDGFTKTCSLFEDLPCVNRKCPYFPDNLDYTTAKERYDAAVYARRVFLKDLLKTRTK